MKKPVLDAVKGISVLWLILSICLYNCGCSGPSDEDRSVLESIEAQFGDRYSFELSGDLYLEVQMKKGVYHSDNETQEIYKSFFFRDFHKMERRKSSYALLNLFDSNGVFLYQLAFNDSSKTFTKGKTPHH